MAAPGAGPGPGPPPGLEAALQKLALRRKKVLSAEEMELFELAQAAGGAMDPDVFKEKQRQRCPWRRPDAARTRCPGRIQPEDAPPAQRHQAAQGGRAGEEPHAEQHLSKTICTGPPQAASLSDRLLLLLVINLFENLRVCSRCLLLPFEYIKAQRFRISSVCWSSSCFS
ncbi:uncharacterized protein [Delphinus delphis]|uniref:uncharacterized protein isoform X1 n=1 Tax=Delphinus delphis TaxID=9728 RepID=UPI0028C387E7|nr:uncharacterized protein LOC132436081 isoform X1 [Delphinus delphis]